MNKKLISSVLIVIILSIVLEGCSGGTTAGPESEWFEDMDTTDLEGNKVDSSVFKENKLTLVNTWATWCNPCVGEIKHLGELEKEMKDKGVGIKGLLIELAEGEDGILEMEMVSGISDEEKKLGEEILEKSKADYQQLLVWDSLKDTNFKNMQAFPTTYFIDSDGKFVGKPVEGSKDKDGWKQIIEERLEMVSDD